MPDSKRQPIEHPDHPRSPDWAEEAGARDSQIDALLEEGLDRYFNSRYEDAIHLWTRVLFLDRTHPRARAYIDRARTGLAEVQRRSEEMLQASRELLDQGRTDAARELLAEAVAATGDDAQTAALRAQLERRERASVLISAPAAQAPPAPVPGWTWRRTSPIAIGAASLAIVAVLLGGIVVFDLTDVDRPGAAPAPAVSAPLPVVSSSGVALIRARALVARGRLSEALLKLDGVAPASPERPAADQLRIEIQQLLLASVQSVTGRASQEAIRR